MTRSLILLSFVIMSCIGPIKARAEQPLPSTRPAQADIVETRDCQVLRAYWQGRPVQARVHGSAAGALIYFEDKLLPNQIEEMRTSAATADPASLSCQWNEQAPPPRMGWVGLTPPLYSANGEFAAFIVIHSPEPLGTDASICLMRNVDGAWQTDRCRMFYIS